MGHALVADDQVSQGAGPQAIHELGCQLRARQVWGRRARLLLEQTTGEYHNAAPGQTCEGASTEMRELHFAFEDLCQLVEAGDLTLCSTCSWERFLTSWAGEPVELHVDFESQVLRAITAGRAVTQIAKERSLTLTEAHAFWRKARPVLHICADHYLITEVAGPACRALDAALSGDLFAEVLAEGVQELVEAFKGAGYADAQARVAALEADPSWVLVRGRLGAKWAARTLPQELLISMRVEGRRRVVLVPRLLFELGQVTGALPPEADVLVLPERPGDDVVEAFGVLLGGEDGLGTLEGALEAATAL